MVRNKGKIEITPFPLSFFPGLTSLLHSQPFYLPSTLSSSGDRCEGLSSVHSSSSLPLLLLHTSPLLQYEFFPWAAVLQDKPASSWALQGPQFLQEIPPCSSVGSSMGYLLWHGPLTSYREIAAPPWSLRSLQGNLCSGPWSTSFPSFFSHFVARRAVSHPFFFLCHVVFCPFLNMFSWRHQQHG